MIRIERYHPGHIPLWNRFVENAANGTFLLDRNYMDYHADRFRDGSLLAFRHDRLLAVLPANRTETLLQSHGGLTYGGFVIHPRLRTGAFYEIFRRVLDLLGEMGIARVEYKPVPHIYHALPAEADLFFLHQANAVLTRRAVSSAIDYRNPLAYSKGRKWCINKARKNGVEIRPSTDFATFMAMEATLLEEKYQTRPVHTAAEMSLLAARFPENIQLFGGFVGDKMEAGVIIYETPQVAHTQYIASTERGRDTGAVDGVLEYLIEYYRDKKSYFDFGISNQRDGSLNFSLNEFKESFGARTIAYDTYELILESPGTA